MSDPAVPSGIAVTVLGGYLGAGKTTLVNHLLRSGSEQMAVLVNDFGSVNIDEDLIDAADERTISLTNGCVCCSLADGLTAALEQVRRLEPRPARLVIEASGVADPAAIAAYAHDRGLFLDGVVTVVDAETVRARAKDRLVGDIVRRQLAAADLVVLNKVDLVEPSEVGALRSWLTDSCGSPSVLEAEHAEVPLAALLGADHVARGSGAPALPADDTFTAWSYCADAVFDVRTLRQTLAAWPADVVRVKGIVRVRGTDPSTPDRRATVQRVGTRLTITETGSWTEGPSRLVAIALRATIALDRLDADLGTAGVTGHVANDDGLSSGRRL